MYVFFKLLASSKKFYYPVILSYELEKRYANNEI